MPQNLIEVIVLTLINSGGLFLIIVLAANSLNESVYKWLNIMTISVVIWTNSAYIGYIQTNEELALLFYRFNGASVSVFILAEYVFCVEGFSKAKSPIIKSIIAVISSVCAVLILITDVIIKDVVWKGWGNEIVFGKGNDLFSLFFLFVNVGLVIFLVNKYLSLEADEKKKALYFLVGIFIFIFSNIVFNVITPSILDTAKYQHFGGYSAVFFLIFTAYAILRHKFMNVKIALTAFLIGIITMFLIVDIFLLSHSLLEQSIKFGLLSFFALIAILLVRSVLSEIKQKETIAIANVELDKSRQQYYELAIAQRDMMDIIGHELRTPLSIIKISLGSLDLKAKKSPDSFNADLYWPHSNKMHSAIERETKLLETMLTSTKIDASRLELSLTKVRLNDLVNDSLLGHQQDIVEKNLEIFTNGTEQEVFIYADKVRFAEVVDNLVSNAIKYTERGSISISVSDTEDMVTLSVKDTGVGMPPEALKRLGEKFYRVKQYSDSNESGNGATVQNGIVRPGGTGLGLYVTFGLVKMMGGEVNVVSEMGKGSCFTVTVPKYINQKDNISELRTKDVFKRLGLENDKETI